MKKETVYLLTILVLFIINCYIAFSFHNYIRNSNYLTEDMEHESEQDSIEIANLRQLFNMQYRPYTRRIEDVIKRQFPEWVGDRHIVVYVKEGCCLPCVVGVLMDFELLRQSTKFENFVLLTDFEIKEERLTELKYYLQCELKNKIVYSDLYDFSKYSDPIVFLVDKELNINFTFVPELFPLMRQEYFTKVLPEYFLQLLE